jgi:elongator complex protein 1
VLWTSSDVNAEENNVLMDEPTEIVGLACALELSRATCATSAGEYATCEVDGSGRVSGCECVGEVPGGVVAFAWCPDGEVCATLTRKGTVIVMTKDLYPLKEEALPDDEDGELSGGTISWRGDGRYFACSSTNAKSGETTMRVWRREDVSVESVGEKGSATSGATATLVGAGREDVPLAWQPRGALIAAAARADNGEDVNDRIVFYERNGLRRGDFTLPGNDEAHVTSLAWSADSACLGVAVRYAKTGERAVQIWTRSNMHWYLKHETRYDASEGKVRMEWDLESGSTLRAFTERGLLERFNLFWETTVSDCGTCAVVDGDALLITPMFRTPVPPPLCAAKIVFDAPVVAAAFRPHRRSGAAETIAALLSTGEIATATSAAGTDWERTADAFADSEACGDVVAVERQRGSLRRRARRPRVSTRLDDALAEHLTWVDDSHLVHVVRRGEDDVSEIVLTPNRRRMRRSESTHRSRSHRGVDELKRGGVCVGARFRKRVRRGRERYRRGRRRRLWRRAHRSFKRCSIAGVGGKDCLGSGIGCGRAIRRGIGRRRG